MRYLLIFEDGCINLSIEALNEDDIISVTEGYLQVIDMNNEKMLDRSGQWVPIEVLK